MEVDAHEVDRLLEEVLEDVLEESEAVWVVLEELVVVCVELVAEFELELDNGELVEEVERVTVKVELLEVDDVAIGVDEAELVPPEVELEELGDVEL